MKTNVAGGQHFYNLIDGHRYELTSDQFDHPIHYDDVPPNRVEALMGATADEYAAMVAAVDQQLQTGDKFS